MQSPLLPVLLLAPGTLAAREDGDRSCPGLGDLCAEWRGPRALTGAVLLPAAERQEGEDGEGKQGAAEAAPAAGGMGCCCWPALAAVVIINNVNP